MEKTKKEKIVKYVKNILIIALMLFISVFSFIGFSVKKDGEYKSVIDDYQFANDFDKYYEYTLSPNNSARDEYVFVDENKNTVRLVPDNNPQTDGEKIKLEEKKFDIKKIKKESGDDKVKNYTIEKRAYRYNNPEVLNENGFNETKNKIIKMLTEQKISGYNIRQNKENGKLIFEIPQSEIEDKNSMVNMLTTDGKFQVVDSLTDREYLTNKDINMKETKVVNTPEYGIVLVIKLTDEGKETFKNVTKKYADIRNKLKEEQDKKNKNKKDKKDKTINMMDQKVEGAPELAIKIGGNIYQKGDLTQEIDTGLIQLPFGKIDPNDETSAKKAKEISILYSALKTGAKPVIYDMDSQKLVEGVANMEKTMNTIYVIAGVFVIIAISLVIFFGFKGILSMIALISYLALMLIVLRYTNIYITISVIMGIIAIYILEFILLVNMNKQLKENKNKDINIFRSYIDEYKELIILLITSVILSFSVYKELASFGKIVFLGIILSLIFNYFLTKNLLKE